MMLLHQETQPPDREIDQTAGDHLEIQRPPLEPHPSSPFSWRMHHRPPNGRGRPRIGWRLAISRIIFRIRSGCQWNKLPSTSGMTVRSTVGSSAGARTRSSRRSGPSWSRNATSWGQSGGSGESTADGMLGKARTGGDEGGIHRPGQAGHQEEPADRWRRRAARCGDRRSERRRSAAVGGDDRGAIVVEQPDPRRSNST